MEVPRDCLKFRRHAPWVLEGNQRHSVTRTRGISHCGSGFSLARSALVAMQVHAEVAARLWEAMLDRASQISRCVGALNMENAGPGVAVKGRRAVFDSTKWLVSPANPQRPRATPVEGEEHGKKHSSGSLLKLIAHVS